MKASRTNVREAFICLYVHKIFLLLLSCTASLNNELATHLQGKMVDSTLPRSLLI